MKVIYDNRIFDNPPLDGKFFHLDGRPVSYRSVGIVPDYLENGMCVKYEENGEWKEVVVDWLNPYEIVERTENGFTMHGPRMLFHPPKFDFEDFKQKGKVIICDNESLFL